MSWETNQEAEMRMLVQVEPDRIEQVKSSLRTIKVSAISQAFDYITIDVLNIQAGDVISEVSLWLEMQPSRRYV